MTNKKTFNSFKQIRQFVYEQQNFGSSNVYDVTFKYNGTKYSESGTTYVVKVYEYGSIKQYLFNTGKDVVDYFNKYFNWTKMELLVPTV